jgi:hypothetical protein
MCQTFRINLTEFHVEQIGHLCLVAGMIDDLGITGIIDEVLPNKRDHVLPHSAIIKAMVLNGSESNHEIDLYPIYKTG